MQTNIFQQIDVYVLNFDTIHVKAMNVCIADENILKYI